MRRFNRVLDAILVALVSYHLIISPYTKVEESFNIQAVHDILKYGVFPIENIDNYDHKQFPGAVPRTFIGSLVLAGLTKPFLAFSAFLGTELQGYEVQTLVRGILGLVNALMLIRLRDSINRIALHDRRSRIKGSIGFWYVIFLISQFHLIYYSSRTVPNFIALPVVNFAISKILVGDLSGLTLLAFTGIVFRLEVGLFGLIIAVVSSLVFGQSNIFVNVFYMVIGTILGGVASVCIDSYFWGRLVIPEIDSFIFNIVQGKSSEWGVEPWGTYFQKYLFQLFRPPIILMMAIPGLLSDPADDGTKFGDRTAVSHPARHSLRILFVSSVLFIAAMSFQPHKEWRFIIYTVPIFTLQAGNGLANISMKWSLGFLNKLLVLIIVCLIGVSSVLSLSMGYISSFNYPGGDALEFTNAYIVQHYNNNTPVRIHMDVASCMTGITQFGELQNELITYDKTEGEVDLNQFDLVITQDVLKNWELLHSSTAFQRISLAPFIQLAMAQQRDKQTLIKFAKIVLSELSQGQVLTLRGLLRSTIVTNNYLRVYKNSNRILPEEQQQQQEEEDSTTVELEIDVEKINKDVNEQIDDVESSIILNS